MSERPTPQEQKSNLADLILKLRDDKVALQERIAELEKAQRLDACTIDHYRQEINDYRTQRKTLCTECRSTIGIGADGMIEFIPREKEHE